MKQFAIALLLLALIIPVRATEDDPFCDAIAVLFEDWQIVEWSDQAASRGELPTDFKMMTWVYLNNPDQADEKVRALEFEYSAERGEMWLFAYRSLVWSDGGNHDLCPIRKFVLVQP